MVSRVRLALCACVALAAAAIARAVDTHVFYYNDVTRESRWDDPESLATHLDDTGRPYWVDADTGESTYDTPKHSAWHAVVSEDDASAGRGTRGRWMVATKAIALACCAFAAGASAPLVAPMPGAPDIAAARVRYSRRGAQPERSSDSATG